MLEHDVLVIGAGLAGMRAAIAARAGGANTAIISKVHPVRSHSNAAQGGINAALTDRGDDWVEHAYDTVKGSDYLGDQDAIEVMCKAAGQALIDMEHFGVTFNRDDEGKLGTRAFGGQRRARTFFVGDFTGQALLHVMFEQLIKSGVRRYEEWFVSSLIIEDGQVCGVMALEIRTGQVYAIRAKTVIFCTGGFGRVFEPSTNALICTGDGTALAYNAGAELMDMEMVQYHPTTLAGSGVLISEAARGEGAPAHDMTPELQSGVPAPDRARRVGCRGATAFGQEQDLRAVRQQGRRLAGPGGDDLLVGQDADRGLGRDRLEGRTALGGAGARGLMQVMPATAKLVARELGISASHSTDRLISEWRYNAKLGANYLAGLAGTFDGNVIMMAAGYNAGPGRPLGWMERYGDPRTDAVDIVDWIEYIPFNETRNYVMRVAESLPIYRARLGGKALPVPFTEELTGSTLASFAP